MSEVPQGPGWWRASDGRWYPPNQPLGPTPSESNGLAIASLVLGIVGFVVPGLASVAAVITGHLGLSQIKRSNLSQGGRGLAIAGLVLGYLQIAAVVVVILVRVGVLASSGSADDPVRTDTSESTTEPSPDSSGRADLPEPAEGIALATETPCPPPEGSERRVDRFTGPPPMCIDPAASYTATFHTSEGDFTARLDAASAPETVNNFVVLARYRYYDGVPFHRVVPDFVIQAGDGDGEPWGNNDSLGYTFADELPSGDDPYPDHSLAMANAGPDTNGSQFFVVLPGGGARLAPSFSRFGQVVEGTDVVDTIAGYGIEGSRDGRPSKAVVIESVEITETLP